MSGKYTLLNLKKYELNDQKLECDFVVLKG